MSKADASNLLEPKSMDVLVYLLEHPDRVVSNDEIIEAVWGGRPMGDNPVYKSVAKLRRALGDDASDPAYIATVAKKGYRLVAEVKRINPDDSLKAASVRHPSILRRSLPIGIGMLSGVLLATILLWRSEPPPLELQSMSSFRGSHSQPSLSPDGSAMAFVNDVDGAKHIWVMEFAENSQRQLSDGPTGDSRPRWSPDGLSILFGRQENIWTIPADGGQANEIIRNASNPNWSRDGTRIVFERRYEVWTADADGGQQTRVAGIAHKELPLSPRWPAFSPDGSEIVYLDSNATPFVDLWRVAIAGGEPQQVTFDPRIASAPVWHPNGQYVVYSSQRSGSQTLWQVFLKDGATRPLLTGSGDDNFPDISADGTRLIYSNRRERFAMMRSSPATGRAQILHESRQMLLGPELSPDADNIAFFGMTANGGVQLFKIPLSTGTATQLTFELHATHAIPRWSADGQDIYFYYSGSDLAFSKVSASGGAPEVVVPGWDWSVTNGASVSPSGDHAAYSRLTGQVPVQTLIRHLASGEDQTFHATLEYPRWSKDGSSLSGSLHVDQRFPGDIAICPLAGPPCRIVAKDARIPMWSADESQVYFVRGFGSSQQLFVAPANGDGDEQKLLDMTPLFPLGPFYDIAPNGDVLWIRYTQELSEIWSTELAAQ